MENTFPTDPSGNGQERASGPGAPHRHNIKAKMIRNKLICIVFLFGLSALIMAFGLQTTTSVLYNGHLVGIVESTDVASVAVAKAEAEASKILGKSCSISSAITYRKGIAATNLSSEELTSAILEKVDGIQNLYILTVDGQVIGGTENRKDIENLLVSTLEKNMSPTSMSAKFSENTQIIQKLVAKGSVPDLSEITRQLTTKRQDGVSLLNVQTVEELEYTAPVCYPTQYVLDDTMYEGQSVCLSQGSNGEAIVTEMQTLQNGYMVSSQIKDTKIITNPTPEVVAVGTIPRYTSRGYYIWPAHGTITSEFGYRDIGYGTTYHTGLDIGVSYGASIYAADGGTVIFAGWYSDYGYLVEIRHDNGDVTRYAHNSKLLVSVGDKVAQGDVIAKAGETGFATGVHCHFELVKSGVRVNPENWLP